ncbi:recombination mediator RecR [uncultured Fretibacterium sp.]|uniref:recombination mediator RecR n=1 Tax=uncultured Fretibacterium sp. TaxID=1678694 RepID=UPI0026367279|nr:recombination mediator RecR [uncultured Fretibacterium sp.]
MDPIADLILSFTKFPGVGNKSARRMVFYLLKRDSAELQDLGRRIATLKDELCVCSRCGNVSSGDPCPICSDALRDRQTLCVVEDIDDLVSFEQAGIYNGLYHVLDNRVSPFDDEDLSPESVDSLLSHIRELDAKEVIIATNPRMEGDLTYYTLLDALREAPGMREGMKISRLAFGLPVGGSIEFADKMTLHTALESRTAVSAGNGGGEEK